MRNNIGKRFLIINILSSVMVGGLIYYFISPEVHFVQLIDVVIGRNNHISAISGDSLFYKVVRNHLLDMLWAYALVFALYIVLGNNAAELMKVFIIAFAFSAIMEIIQLTSIAEGTFDVVDIIVEFFAEVAAVFIIKRYNSEEEKKHEKPN
ncbi:MAG: hypothetical protein HUJ70_05750 [Pseudobutyrivibrio sp.]|nr:hypothetical protein [Pseudobutyrivibrio sp.]